MAPEGDGSVQVPAHEAALRVYKPCHFEPVTGATKTRCIAISGRQVKNGVCCGMGCASPWKRCKGCVAAGFGDASKAARPGSNYCADHQDLQRQDDAQKRREAAQDGKKKPNAFNAAAPASEAAKNIAAHLRKKHDEEATRQVSTKAVVASTYSAGTVAKPAASPKRAEREVKTTGAMPVVETKEEGRRIIAEIKKAIANADYEVINAKRVKPMKDQPRKFFDPYAGSSLTGSIKDFGQIMPGYVRVMPLDAEGRDRELVDGERRWRGVIEAGVETYRAMRIVINDAGAQYLASVIANFHRQGHTTLEIADAICAMHERLKIPLDEIAELVGFHLTYVSQLYGLRRLIPEARALIDPNSPQYVGRRKFPLTAALKISVRSPEAQRTLVDGYLAGRISLLSLRTEGRRLMQEQGLAVHKHGWRVTRYVGDKSKVVFRQLAELKMYIDDLSPEDLGSITTTSARSYTETLEDARKHLETIVKKLQPMTREGLV